MKIGIMQGRLVPPEGGRFQSFPRSGWRREIEFAAVAGLDCIEWIDDQFGIGENPLWSSSGLAELRALSTRHGVAVRSVCADWFMENPLLRCGEIERRTGVARLCQLIAIGGEFGIARIVIPFVDNSRIEGDDDVQAVVRTLLEVEPAARRRSRPGRSPLCSIVCRLQPFESTTIRGIARRLATRRPRNLQPMARASEACTSRIDCAAEAPWRSARETQIFRRCSGRSLRINTEGISFSRRRAARRVTK